jgi:hypothetical protein
LATPEQSVVDLDQALTELETEGVYSPDAPAVDGDPAATAPQDTPERAPQAATPKATGDGRTEVEATAADSPAQPDPLEGTEPYKYTFGNESKVLEGFYRVPGEGVMIPEDKVPQLEQLAVRAEMLDRASREHESANALFERLSEWTSVGADGKEVTLKGAEAIQQGRLDYARQAAYRQVSDAYFNDPNRLASLLTFNPETQQFERNEAEWDKAKIMVENATIRAETETRGWLAQRYQEPPKPQAPNYAEQAPIIIQQLAQSANADPSVLTPDDRSYLAEQLPRYIRPATREDIRVTPTLQMGQPVVDAAFRAVVTRSIQMRKSSVDQAQAATKASQFNAGQDKGLRAGKPQIKSPPSKPATQQPQKPGKADWDAPLQAALDEMGIQ